MILISLVVSLSAMALSYGAYLLWTAARVGQLRPSGEALGLGAVTNFFDTLGIGSFAPSIAWMRFRSATSLPTRWAVVAVAVHFLLGVLLSFGVGNYAPTLKMLSLMGMDPRLAFPIMACAASFGGLAASGRSLHIVKLDYRIVLGLALGAIPAVLVAAFIVKEMPMTMLRWLVVVVVSYAGGTLLLSATRRTAVAIPDVRQSAVLD